MAQTFTFEDENGVNLSHVSRLDTMVNGRGRQQFLRQNRFKPVMNLGEEDNRTDMICSSIIEFADVIVLNKLDLVDDEQTNEVEAIINALNPGAEVIATT